MPGESPVFTNMYDILHYAAHQWPDNDSVIDEHGHLSYTQLLSDAEQLKEKLRKAGIKKGQGLGVMARNGRGFILGLFSGMGCGSTVLPISHQMKREEIDMVVSEAGLHAVLDDLSGTAPIETEGNRIELGPLSFRLAWTAKNRDEPMVPKNNAAFVRFTSGTTGQSKGVVFTHQSLLDRISTAQKALGLAQGEVVLWILPMAYHFLVTIVVYLRYGITIAVCRDILAQSMLDCANDNRATFFFAAPIHFRILASDQSDQKFHSLQRVISTSSAIPIQDASAFQNRFGLEVRQAYGITEAGLPLVNLQIGDELDLGAVGKVAPGFEIEILDENIEKLPAGATGELGIRGPGMFDAYLKPWRTKDDVFQNGWFLTGDLATESEEGMVRIVGRKKSMINVAGNKVFPEEVEVILNQYPGIKISRAYGMAHPIMGEIVHANIVGIPGAEFDPEDVISYCRKNLSTFKVPQRVQFVSDIPLTDSGKVIRS